MQIVIKLTCSIFMFSNNLFIILFTFIKISNDSSYKYYQNNKERLRKKLRENIKVFLRTKKKKKQRCGANNTKIYQKMKNKCLLSIEKVII